MEPTIPRMSLECTRIKVHPRRTASTSRALTIRDIVSALCYRRENNDREQTVAVYYCYSRVCFYLGIGCTWCTAYKSTNDDKRRITFPLSIRSDLRNCPFSSVSCLENSISILTFLLMKFFLKSHTGLSHRTLRDVITPYEKPRREEHNVQQITSVS